MRADTEQGSSVCRILRQLRAQEAGLSLRCAWARGPKRESGGKRGKAGVLSAEWHGREFE